MPWVVGVDEAGYGPNLGPLVQAAVAVRLPEDDPAGWATVKAHVRRAGEGPAGDRRVLVDDSKKVHSGPHPLRRLERGLAAVLGPPSGHLGPWLGSRTLPGVLDDLTAEPWFDPTEPLPLHRRRVADLRPRLADLEVEARLVGVSLVPAPLFNRIVAGSGSKATVLSAGLIGLVAAARTALTDGEPVTFVCDKQGGRNGYAAMLTAAFPDGWVHTEHESADESRYRVDGLDRSAVVQFRPRAESASISVALASMACKYLREICMRQFNRFWAQHVPDLKPTAGYPGDARRYYDAIRPAMAMLGLAEEAVWRCR
jgi:hypothetical protein